MIKTFLIPFPQKSLLVSIKQWLQLLLSFNYIAYHLINIIFYMEVKSESLSYTVSDIGKHIFMFLLGANSCS